MRTFINSLKEQAAAVLVATLVSLFWAGGVLWLSVRDLKASQLEQEKEISHALEEQKVLNDRVTKLLIATERLTVVSEQLTKQVDRLQDKSKQ